MRVFGVPGCAFLKARETFEGHTTHHPYVSEYMLFTESDLQVRMNLSGERCRQPGPQAPLRWPKPQGNGPGRGRALGSWGSTAADRRSQQHWPELVCFCSAKFRCFLNLSYVGIKIQV